MEACGMSLDAEIITTSSFKSAANVTKPRWPHPSTSHLMDQKQFVSFQKLKFDQDLGAN
jgi:hypothetical protein